MDAWKCPDCGLDYGTLTPETMPGALLRDLAGFRQLVDGEDLDRLWRRPDDNVWSAVEYMMHTAEVVDLLEDVLIAMAVGAAVPEFWDPDERAAAERYNDRQPADALRQLDAALAVAAQAVAALGPDGWSRTATFPWGERDSLTMAQNMVHETRHHLMDARRSLDAAPSPTDDPS